MDNNQIQLNIKGSDGLIWLTTTLKESSIEFKFVHPKLAKEDYKKLLPHLLGCSRSMGDKIIDSVWD